jgi:hypothetical protein
MANNNVVIKLSADIAKFQADMQLAGSSTQRAMAQMERDAKMVGAAMGALGLAGAGALAIMVKQSIDAADKLRDMSQKTAIAVETLNGMGFAASQAGGSLDGMVAAAGKLNKAIAEAAQGTPEQANAFKALGISVQDSSGKLKTADVVMAEMADKFAAYADGPEKVALANALMGKSGADMIPVLNDGGAAMRDNIEYAKQYSGLTTELAAGADQFNDSMGKLHLQQQGFANTITAAVLPVLQAVADETLRAAEESNGFSLAANAARTVLETFVVIGSEVAFVFKGVGTEIGGMAAQLAALASGDIKGFTAISDAMKADAAKASVEHDAFIARVMDRSAPNANGFASNFTSQYAKRSGAVMPLAAAPKLPGSGAESAIKKAADESAKAIAFYNGLMDKASGYTNTYAADQNKLALALKNGAIGYDDYTTAVNKLMLQQPFMVKELADATKSAQERQDLRNKEYQDIENWFKAEQAQNEANVGRIRISLMTEVEQEQLAHDSRLKDLQRFHDLKFENVAVANEIIEKENARHQQVLADMQSQRDLDSLSMFGSTADALYGLMQKAGQEQSALGKAAFLVSKAAAVAEIIVQTNVAATKAEGQLGIFGLPMSAIILGTGYARAGMVAGMAIADASAEGGYDIPSGTNPVTQLHEREMVLPREQADVIRGLASNGGTASPMALTIVNQTSGRIDKVTEQRISPTERALIIQEAVNAQASAMSDPNSRTSRAMGRNYATQRSR